VGHKGKQTCMHCSLVKGAKVMLMYFTAEFRHQSVRQSVENLANFLHSIETKGNCLVIHCTHFGITGALPILPSCKRKSEAVGTPYCTALHCMISHIYYEHTSFLSK